MNAKEMFEELGCEYLTNDDGTIINYVKYYHDFPKMDKAIILFDSNVKRYECIYDRNYEINGHNEMALGITMELHKAIHQQLIELGWIE